MFDVGWSELLLIGVVALIVLGPEDLPKLFRTMGRITARARSMAREFSSAMEDAAKSSGLEDAAKTLKEVNSLTSKKSLGLDALDRAADRFEKWDPLAPTRAETKNTILPDPSAPKPAVPPVASNTSQPDAVIPPAALDALPPPPVAAFSAPADVTPPAAEAPGRRRLHAVRRSDSDAASEKKGD